MRRRNKRQCLKIKIHIFAASFASYFSKECNIEGEKARLLSARFTKSVMKAADVKCISCHLLSLSLTVQSLLILGEWQCWELSKAGLCANCPWSPGLQGQQGTLQPTITRAKINVQLPTASSRQGKPHEQWPADELCNYSLIILSPQRMQMPIRNSRHVSTHLYFPPSSAFLRTK